MAGPEQVQGINTAMLASMSQHAAHAGDAAALGGGGNAGIGMQIGGEISQGLKTQIGVVGVGNADELIKCFTGALEQNPFEAFTQNMSPFGIAHQGFDMKFSGDIGLANVAPGKQLSAPPAVPGLISHGAGGQEH